MYIFPEDCHQTCTRLSGYLPGSRESGCIINRKAKISKKGVKTKKI